jgi:hypothetical protein
VINDFWVKPDPGYHKSHGLPYWMRCTVGKHELWAPSLGYVRHLTDYLTSPSRAEELYWEIYAEELVPYSQTENPQWWNYWFDHHLPTWVKLAKNRSRVLKALRKMVVM